MNESKHTPGKWIFRTAGNGDCGISAEGTGVFIEAFAEIRHSGENAREEALSNARLIAAAPDLLDWLKSIVADHDTGHGVSLASIGHARVAIAKAEGRS